MPFHLTNPKRLNGSVYRHWFGWMVGHFRILCIWFSGLINNPDLKVVLMFDYETWKAGGGRFRNKLLEPLSQNNVLIVGGQVERAFSNNTTW